MDDDAGVGAGKLTTRGTLGRGVAVGGGIATAAGVLAAAVAAFLVAQPAVGSLPARADAVLVFAGNVGRIEGALDLVPARAPVLVVSAAGQPQVGGLRCDQREPFQVLCVRPSDASTRGEARMFARIAEEQGWENLIAVTSRDHVRRARWHLRRCWDGPLWFAARGGNREPIQAIPYEAAGLLKAAVFERSC